MYQITRHCNNGIIALCTTESLNEAINTIAFDINTIAGEDVYSAFDENFAIIGLEEEINNKGKDTLFIDDNLKYVITKI